MRVVAGSAGGIPLQVPKHAVRPTSDRVRESLFSVLGESVSEAKVLDLYAGAGALGIEALSRGAESAVFVEKHRPTSEFIRRNLEKARLEKIARIVVQEVDRFLNGATTTFDLVFADPPYAKSHEEESLAFKLLKNESLPNRLADSGVLILEAAHPSPEPDLERWDVRDHRQYGATAIWILQKK
ncbi:MAG: 16S rRNA (guanine(966)-N(2))-methyltransferase RsmD [Verrucomicrobiota bacterium]